MIEQLFGSGKDLNILQMCDRAIVVFFLALLLLRIAGRRSFGMKSPFDNIIVLLLGAILSRAVAGASPFVPTIAASLVLVLLHRLSAWAGLHNRALARLIKGERFTLFEAGAIRKQDMQKGLVTEEDLMEGVRKAANKDSLEKVEAVYLETNGEISVVKKE